MDYNGLTLAAIYKLSRKAKWKVNSLYNVSQLAYILRANGHSDEADDLEDFYERMNSYIESEFEVAANA